MIEKLGEIFKSGAVGFLFFQKAATDFENFFILLMKRGAPLDLRQKVGADANEIFDFKSLMLQILILERNKHLGFWLEGRGRFKTKTRCG